MLQLFYILREEHMVPVLPLHEDNRVVRMVRLRVCAKWYLFIPHEYFAKENVNQISGWEQK